MDVIELLRHLELESMMRVEVLTPFDSLEWVIDVLVICLKVAVQVQVEAQCRRTLWYLMYCFCCAKKTKDQRHHLPWIPRASSECVENVSIPVLCRNYSFDCSRLDKTARRSHQVFVDV